MTWRSAYMLQTEQLFIQGGRCFGSSCLGSLALARLQRPVAHAQRCQWALRQPRSRSCGRWNRQGRGVDSGSSMSPPPTPRWSFPPLNQKRARMVTVRPKERLRRGKVLPGRSRRGLDLARLHEPLDRLLLGCAPASSSSLAERSVSTPQSRSGRASSSCWPKTTVSAGWPAGWASSGTRSGSGATASSAMD